MERQPDIGERIAAQSLSKLLNRYYGVQEAKDAPISIWDKYRAYLHSTFDLSDRQADCAIEAVRGYSNNEIAKKLNIDLETVNKHLDGVYKKLGQTKRRGRRGLVALLLEINLH